jgi:sulfide dehydrogenase cytochrome subunit
VSDVNGTLAGMTPADFIEKMLGFKDGSRKATVMHHHAKGLSVEEIKRLSVHFSQQKRIEVTPLKSQTLKADHE